jgi:hypothetical protein
MGRASRTGSLRRPVLQTLGGMNGGKKRGFGDDRRTTADRPRTLVDLAVRYDHDDVSSRLEDVRLQRKATDLLDETNSYRYHR